MYDKDSMIYYLASESKLRTRDTIGNLLALNRDRCLLSGEGKLLLGVNLGRITTSVVGRVMHNLNNHETSMDVMMSFNFHFDEGLAGMIAAKIEGTPTLTGVDMRRSVYIRGMNEWLGVQRAGTYRRDASLGKVNNFPAELNKTLVLTQLRLYWNQSTRSYRSTGKIGVGNLFGYQVNRIVEGMIEIRKKIGGDEMDIYLKLDEQNWFYFGYTREMMQVLSSDQTFNDRLQKLPDKIRKVDGRPGFKYMIAASDKPSQIMRIYQQRDTSTEQLPPTPTVTRDTETAPVVTPQPVVAPAGNEDDDAPIIEVD
jgi:hypothetical protein